MPSLTALIEVSFGNTPNWLPALPDKHPQFVQLNGNVSDTDILLVLHTAALFNATGSDEPYVSLHNFLPENISAISGGLLAKEGKTEVYPSCCCGLESWREWSDLLSGIGTPWLGHDPSPFVEVTAEGFRVWPDGGLGEVRPDIATSILFTRDQLSSALITVETDLYAFLDRLKNWCEKTLPENSATLIASTKNLLAIHHEKRT